MDASACSVQEVAEQTGTCSVSGAFRKAGRSALSGHQGVGGLGAGAHHHGVDIDVGGPLQGPHNALGDVLGHEGACHARVDGVGLGLVPVEPVEAERSR